MVDPEARAGSAAAIAQVTGRTRAAGDEETEVVAWLTTSVVVDVHEVRTVGHAVATVPGMPACVAIRRTLSSQFNQLRQCRPTYVQP